MRKLLSLFLLLLIILSGCRISSFGSHVEIDWVDFIKWNGREYDGIYTGVIADEKYIGEKLGNVKFKVADHVSDPQYKIREGDAAFQEKGTVIFTVKGQPNLIAVKSSGEINGYRVYFSGKNSVYKWNFKDLPFEKVNRVEIFQSNSKYGNKKISELKNTEEINHFLQILKNSKENPNFQPNMEKSDPTDYQMVLYTDEPIAYRYDMQFDGHTYFWYPGDTSILSNEMESFIPVN